MGRVGGRQVSLVAPIETGIVNLPSVREGGKRRQPHIHTHHIAGWRQRIGLCLAREAGEPLAGTRPGERHRLGRTLHRTVQDDMHGPDFREDKALTFQPHAISILGIRDRVVPAEAFEARKPDLSGTLLHPTKEGLKGQIDSYADVLEYLTMHKLHGWASQLPDRKEVQRIVRGLVAVRPLRGLAAGVMAVVLLVLCWLLWPWLYYFDMDRTYAVESQ